MILVVGLSLRVCVEMACVCEWGNERNSKKTLISDFNMFDLITKKKTYIKCVVISKHKSLKRKSEEKVFLCN